VSKVNLASFPLLDYAPASLKRWTPQEGVLPVGSLARLPVPQLRARSTEGETRKSRRVEGRTVVPP